MSRLFFAFFIMSLAILTLFGMNEEVNEPSSPTAQEGKTVYLPISPAVNVINESNIQQADHNSTGHGKAR